LKQQNRIGNEDPEFLEALEEPQPTRRSSDRQAQRKARQFCRQVQRALNLSLSDQEIYVEEVIPAPDCGHLLVSVSIPTADALAALRQATPRLRSEVAAAITRKRAPELSFIPAFREGGADE
jgi:ribosome-binding factor A